MTKETPQSTVNRLGDKAKEIASDAKAAAKLLDAAIKKADNGRSPLTKVWIELQSTFRMVGAWISGQYRGVSMSSIVAAIAGLLYLVNPLDLVTDFIPGIGLLDDATVLAFVISRIRTDLRKFLSWEAENSKTGESEVKIGE